MIIGVDEAGRGPVIGPLVVAALAIPQSEIGKLSKMGVDDSKVLSSSKRLEIRNQIFQEKTWKHCIICFSAEQIDRAMEHDNLNAIEVQLFAKSIEGIEIEIETVSKLILDACDVNEARFGRNVISKLRTFSEDSELISEHKADSRHLIVGAASILAKVHRDLEVEKIADECGIEIGSGYPSDPKTKEALPLLLVENLPHKHLRWSWATVKKAWKESGRGKVPMRPRITQNVGGQTSLDTW